MEVTSLALPNNILRETCYNMKDVDRGIFLTGCILQSRFGVSISNIVSVRPLYRCWLCGDITYEGEGLEALDTAHQPGRTRFTGTNTICRDCNNQPIPSGHEHHRSYEFSMIGDRDAYNDAYEVEKKERVVDECTRKVSKAAADSQAIPYLEMKARVELAEAVRTHQESLVTLTPSYRQQNRELYIGEIEFERDDKQRFRYILSRANWIHRTKGVPLSRTPVTPVFSHEASRVDEV